MSRLLLVLGFLTYCSISCLVVEVRCDFHRNKMSYPNLIQRLYKTNIFNPVKLGLENMQRLNKLLNNPLGSIPIVHVTGTNGKGSVSLKLSRCLRESDIRTGLFTSPHISSFRERIKINEDNLTESDVEVLLAMSRLHCGHQLIVLSHCRSCFRRYSTYALTTLFPPHFSNSPPLLQ